MNLDVLVFVGGTFLGASVAAELLRKRGEKCKVVSVAASGDFCEHDPSALMEKAASFADFAVCPTFDTTPAETTSSLSAAEMAVLESGAARKLGFDSQTKAAAELVGSSVWPLRFAEIFFPAAQVSNVCALRVLSQETS